MGSINPLPERQHEALLLEPWFARLPADVQLDVMVHGRPRDLADGERLFGLGEACDGMFAILEGKVRVSSTSALGREAVLDFYRSGQWLGEVRTLGGGPRIYDAHAFGPTQLLHVTPWDIEGLMSRHPVLCRELIRSIGTTEWATVGV